MSAEHDPVDHPTHYTSHPSGVECVQITEHMGFLLGNAIKYIWRADLKADAVEDLKKARWYLDREIANREKTAIEPAAGGDWLAWHGGECPVAPNTVVETWTNFRHPITYKARLASQVNWKYESGPGAIKAYRIVSLADADDWIEWRGGEQPVDSGVVVEYVLRGGHMSTQLAHILTWKHVDMPYDIVRYRVVKQG